MSTPREELGEMLDQKLRTFSETLSVKNKGGKETKSEGDFITKSDLKMTELEKAKESLERTLAEQSKHLEDPVISRYLKHKATCTDEHCIFDLAPNDVFQAGEKAGYDNGYEKGKAAGKENLTVEEVDEWLTSHGFFPHIKSISIPSRKRSEK